MVRKILGVFVGMIAASVMIMIAQMAMMLVVAPPSAETMQDPETLRAWISAMPVTADLLLALGYAIGAFAGGFVAGKIAGAGNGFLPALLIGMFLTIAGIVNFFFTMPGSPMWLIVLCLLIYEPFALLGQRVAK